jgi:hypothetical protein
MVFGEMCLFVYLDDISGYIEPEEFGRYSGRQDLLGNQNDSGSANPGLTLNSIRRLR